jgi:hypothetical protein
MMMIEKVSGIDFVKGHEITDLKPQFPAPVITMDIPYTSVAPCSTRSSTVAHPPSSSNSSSTDRILRVLKSMFCM